MIDKPMNPYAETDFDKAVDDALEEMSRKDKTMTEKPRNPFATEDFANAIKKASEDLAKGIEKMKDDFPFMAYDDVYPEYGGRMKLKQTSLWESLIDTLTDEGYEVTVKKEVASEVEREVDGIDKWIVIEFGEVE